MSDSNVLAIALYLQGDLSEGRPAGSLGVGRVEARSRVAEFLNTAIDNTQVPIQRIQILEQRVATLITQAAQIATENHDLRNRSQVQQLDIGELRQALLALTQRIESLGNIGYLDPADIELQLQDAREVLARAGLL